MQTITFTSKFYLLSMSLGKLFNFFEWIYIHIHIYEYPTSKRPVGWRVDVNLPRTKHTCLLLSAST